MLVSDKPSNDIGILQTKLHYSEGHEAQRGGLYPSPCRDTCPDRAPWRQVAAGGGVRLGGGAKCCLTFLYCILDDAEVFTVFKDDEADDD